MQYTLPKHERLCSFKEINDLLKEGESLFNFPFKLVYSFSIPSEDNLNMGKERDFSFPVKIMVSVPKKNFKRAVKRNLLKRRMREAYRLNKGILTTKGVLSGGINILFIYVAKEELSYKLIENSICNLLKKLKEVHCEKF